jgi:hypothetical protein
MDVQSYTELKLKFDRMIEKDRVRKRRTRRVAFGAHAVIAAFAILVVISGPYFGGGFENGLRFLLFAGALLSTFLHWVTLNSASESAVEETVRESLMVLAGQRLISDVDQRSEKRKREMDEITLALSDDGELVQRRRG